MKIHIVQKGDTLWNLAEKYGVDFDELKKANSHLPNPDMIMPGMKVKIPTSAVLVKKDAKKKKPLPTFEDLKGTSKKGIPKKEMPIVDYSQKEMLKAEPAKKEAPIEEMKDKTAQLKHLLKDTTPKALKVLLQEVKPDFLESWSMELKMMKEKKTYPTPPKMLPIEKVEPMPPIKKIEPIKPTPPPQPEWVMPVVDKQMPLPFKPEEVHPCPPHPCPPYPVQHKGSYYSMSPLTQQYPPPTQQYMQQPTQQYTQQPIPHYTQPSQYSQQMQPTPSYYPMQGMPSHTSPYVMPGAYNQGKMSPYQYQAPSDCGCPPNRVPNQARSPESQEE